MSILFIIFILALIAYIAFNVYAISKVWSFRIPNDQTQQGIFIYIAVMILLIVVSLIVVGRLDWGSQ